MDGFRMTPNSRICSILILAAAVVTLVIVSRRQKAAEREKKRREALKRDYPELISKLLLLMQAGLVTRSAMMRIAADHRQAVQSGKKPRPAFEEVERTCNEMARGISEEEAYQRFGKRCALPVYRTLSVLLVQSIQKGGTGLSQLLEREIVAAMEERKRTARIDGERASIRLLLPMGMMLVVVLALLIVPAFLSF